MRKDRNSTAKNNFNGSFSMRVLLIRGLLVPHILPYTLTRSDG